MYEGRLLRPAPARDHEPTQAAGLEELVKQSIEEIEDKDPVVEFGENAIHEYKNKHGGTVSDNVEKAIERPYEPFDEPENEPEETEPVIVGPELNEEMKSVIDDVKNGKDIEPSDINELAEIRDNPATTLIETSWTKPSPAYQNGKLILKSRSDGKQHVFEGATAEEARAKAYASLKLFYDVSNLSL